jgi:hypothetical protein
MIKKLLTFLNLMDGDQVSITNLCMYVLIVKVALVPHASIPDLGALFLATANYLHKRYVASQAPDPTPAVNIQPLLARIESVDKFNTALTQHVDSLTKDLSTLKSAITLKSLK